jgi:hypothetical protein
MTALGWCARSHFQQQLAAAGRLWPAEAWRARTAILLSCGEPAVEAEARRALRSRWGIDEVLSLMAPVRAIAEPDPRTLPWLRAWLAREIHGRAAALVAVAAHPACAHCHGPGAADAFGPTHGELQAAVAQLRDWGVTRDVEPLWLEA